MASTSSTRRRKSAGTRRRPARTARPVRSAAERAVERVLSSDEAFALLVRRLEAAGWHIEREVPPARPTGDVLGLTAPARPR
jgi:hypothetical protein